MNIAEMFNTCRQWWRKLAGGGRSTPESLYGALFERLNADALGRGRDVHSQDRDLDWPSAYGLILSAELILQSEKSADYAEAGTARKSIRDCTEWLLSNQGCATTGAPFWSVPYSRKIWDDLAPVKGDTGFTIPTCHAIQGLAEYASEDFQDSDTRARAEAVAVSACKYLAEHCFDPTDDGLVFWYSPLRQHGFHVTNATAMAAGQIQRMSALSPCGATLSKQADRAVRELLCRCQEYENVMYWCYFGTAIPKSKTGKNRTNDLLHEAFVCHGLLDYKEFGGRLGTEFDYKDLYRALLKFHRNNAMHDYSSCEGAKSRLKKPARISAMGHALYVASRLEYRMGDSGGLPLADLIFSELRDGYLAKGKFMDRPDGMCIESHVRDVAHVLLGIAEYSVYLSRRESVQ